MEKVHSTVCALLFAFVAIAHFNPVSAGDGGLSGKPGNCPPLSWFGVVKVCPYIRVAECTSDYQCPGNEKCCFNGCGPVCVDPYTPPPPPPPPTNPGDCPAPIYKDPRWCAKIYQRSCTCDQDCGKVLKCCNNGCGPTCVKPVIAPPPPPPPPTNPGDCPAPIYTDPRWCPKIYQRSCTCDQDCGKVLKCCNNGCGFTCVKPVIAPPPPPPPPTNPGDCPAPIYPDPRWCPKIYQRSCTCDQDCGKVLKCCNNGCGFTCVKPVVAPPPPPPPPTNPGDCPAPIYTDPRWCPKIYQRSCTCDQDCGKVLKCCNNGCGFTCVKPVIEPPPPPPTNPGDCPAPIYRDPRWCPKVYQRSCTCDQDCGKELKCCNNGCGPTCVEPVIEPPPPPPTNPGACPAPIYKDQRWCSKVYQRSCTCDQDCGKTLKCCNNGCGLTCVEPVLAGKPGKCPRPTGFGICIQECDNDGDCPNHLKCCSNGCGHVCSEPAGKW